ncbi:class I SAM-dependent methyltransferase [Aurantiacibacter sediminis]|uniref:Methyltransferase domain-containing protein n=1 Tax=Aurantiacibacter sediminis TaxID=2793064 RepID=A0ABS0N2R8_9SPHN|nr:class I SAM-dependent methyltransferase [Aurantiacibacter sediminis]MBH5322265.1 methyltransferase domain-containing protein [Aurantiacibacter sediminis]
MSDPATLAYYEKSASYYTLSFAQAPSRDLDSFLDKLKPEARILELGCGGGQDAARMMARGFSVDATDGVSAMVRKANERFAVGARQMRFDELLAHAKYDAVWAHACLLHVPRADLPNVLSRIHQALRQGGWHYASFKLGDGEGRCLLGRLHNFPDPDWITAQYRQAGFTIVDERIWEGEGTDGTVRDWIAITARKLT